MIIERTVEIPADRRIFLDLPRSIPAGAKAKVSISFPSAFESQSPPQPGAKSFRGILKGKGISVERLREMQHEDKTMEDEADSRRGAAAP